MYGGRASTGAGPHPRGGAARCPPHREQRYQQSPGSLLRLLGILKRSVFKRPPSPTTERRWEEISEHQRESPAVPHSDSLRNDRDTCFSSKEILKMYGSRIDKHERRELRACREIWYYSAWPPQRSRAHVACYEADGHYIPVQHEHLLYRYEVLEVLGQGSFGKVLKCLDHKSKEFVAVKVLNKVRFNQNVHRRELEILTRLRTHGERRSNVIRMMEHFSFRGRECVVFELVNGNLRSQLELSYRQGFGLDTVRLFAISLLKSLKQLRDANVIHGDLKPENIGVCSYEAGEVKLFDFGCSCFDHEDHFSTIQTRNYRAPEVILGLGYSFPADMWSLGCTLAELHSGHKLFPGRTDQDQLHAIMEVFGLPPQNMIEESRVRLDYFDADGRPHTCRCPARAPGSRGLPLAIATTDELFTDFIKSCLQWDPEWRLTPHGAMQHEWVQGSRLPSVPSATPDLDGGQGPGAAARGECGCAPPLREEKDPGATLRGQADPTTGSSATQGTASPSHNSWADHIVQDDLVFAPSSNKGATGTLFMQEEIITDGSSQQDSASTTCSKQEPRGTSQGVESPVTSSAAQKNAGSSRGPKAEAARASVSLTMTPVDPSPAAVSDCNGSMAPESSSKRQAARTRHGTIQAAEPEDVEEPRSNGGQMTAPLAEEVVQGVLRRRKIPSQRFYFANKKLRPFFRRFPHCHCCCRGGDVSY